jgi:predicted Zn-dependent peptidase
VVVAWRGPDRGTKEFYALGLLEHVLYEGTSSRLYQGLVKGKEVAIEVQGGMGFPLGSYTDYVSPALVGVFAIYKPVADAKGMVDLIQGEVDRIAREGIGAEELHRAKVQFRSRVIRGLTGTLERAIRLGVHAHFDGDAGRLTADLARFLETTPEDLRAAAARHLISQNRVVVDIQPARSSPPVEGAQGEEE